MMSASEPRPDALLIVRDVGGQRVVIHGCSVSLRAGVRAGLTLSHATALLSPRTVHTCEHQPERDAAALRGLVRWASRWSPVIEADPPDGLLMDITGCAHLFRGEERLAGSLRRALRALGLRAKLCIASNIGAAWAVARHGKSGLCVLPHGHEEAAIGPLPCRALRLEPEVIAALEEVGVERVRELLELPRSALPARFGSGLVMRIDQALGLLLEPVWRTQEQERLMATLELPGGTTRLEALEAAARRVLDDLCARIAALESGLRAIEITLERIGSQAVCLSIELGSPSRSPRHLWSMLWPRLERVNMGFGIERVTMTALRAARLPHRQKTLPVIGEATGVRDAAAGELLDTIAARIGRERVLRFELAGSHIPERAAVIAPYFAAGGRPNMPGAATNLSPRPSVLIDPPEAVRVIALTPDGPFSRFTWRGRISEVVVCEGPERIAHEWWLGRSPARDYFRVQDEAGRWVWLFREAEAAHWFIHGVWA
jgi:protein ImuB